MKISKPVERWFDVPDDPDKARLKIKHLSPGERSEIFDQAFKQSVSYTKTDDGKYEPLFSQDTDKKADRELTIVKSVVDWENFFDHDDKSLACTPENVLRASKEIEGFNVLINELRAVLEADIKEEQEQQRKNSQSSVSGRKK